MRRIIGVLLGFGLLLSLPALVWADGTYSNPGTSDANDCSSDCLTWSQSPVWITDKYGKFIITTQARSGPITHFAYSNDNGATWTQASEDYAFFERGSMAYDSNNDVIHVIWNGTQASDGIIYRRYSITRDGSNNITSIQRMDTGVNLQLDTSSSRLLGHPIAFWVNDGSTNGILVAIWAKYGSGLTEVRGSMRRLSMTNADNTASNWLSLSGNPDTFNTDPPAVPATSIFGSVLTGTSAVAAKIRGGSGPHKDDLYVFPSIVLSGGMIDDVLAYRFAWNSGVKNWSSGTTSLGTFGHIGQLSGGYNLKVQLISKPVIDKTNDRLYVGWARWKDNTFGDTVSFAYLNSSDVISSPIDVYSANGTHSYAPTLDLSFDNTAQKLYIAYILSTTNGDNGSIQYKTYDGSSLSSPTTFYTSPGGSAGQDGSADIPQMMADRFSTNNRIYIGFRVNGALPPTSGDPHTLRLGFIDLASSTPTPTPTTAATPTSAPAASMPGAPSCTASTPNGIPNLFQITSYGTYAKLYFTTVTTSTTGYSFSYGTTPAADQYGDTMDYSGPAWVIDHTIGGLSPNTKYYFKVRAKNNCTAGSWSAILSAQTQSRLTDLVGMVSSPQITPPTGCSYRVQWGDSLWKIAGQYLGFGGKYIQLVGLNPNLFSLSGIKTILRVGWTLKVC